MSSPLETFAQGLDWGQLLQLTADKPTPFVLLNLSRIRQGYADLSTALPEARIHYAVKANPDPGVISVLAELGSCFELASRAELDLVLGLGVSGDRYVFGNTIKKPDDIAYYHQNGISLFATDSEADVRKLAQYAPGAKVYVRLLAEPSATADWPLDRKFGCPADTAVGLMRLAKELGLQPYGVSFHVGSQQNSPEPWRAALQRTAWVFEQLRHDGIQLKLINLGGGLPVSYLQPVPPVEAYAQAIRGYIAELFAHTPELIIEPGRFLVADAGLLVSEVMLVAKKQAHDEHRWVYTDIGLFSGLTEADKESTKYSILTTREGPVGEVIIAGPTCDGRDILYDNYRYRLPLTLADGDRLYFFKAGAYTLSCGTVGYNGFNPTRGYGVEI